MSTVHLCQEIEHQTGMQVGLPKVRYICPCGWSSDWHRSGYNAKKEFQKHANACDTAVYVFLGEPQKSGE